MERQREVSRVNRTLCIAATRFEKNTKANLHYISQRACGVLNKCTTNLILSTGSVWAPTKLYNKPTSFPGRVSQEKIDPR